MDKIKLISHNTLDGVQAIKTACLYFDNVDAATYHHSYVKEWFHRDDVNRKKYTLHEEQKYIADIFNYHVDPLVKAGIVKTTREHYSESVVSFNQRKVDPAEYQRFKTTIVDNIGFFFKNNDPKQKQIVGNEPLEYFGEYEIELKNWLDSIEMERNNFGHVPKEYFGHIPVYYYNLLNITLSNLSKGVNCITNSGIINKLLVEYFHSNEYISTKSKFETNVDPNTAFNAINMAIPNVSKLSSEDILNLRENLNDELIAFKHYLKCLQVEQKNNFDEKSVYFASKELAETKIRPALNDLKEKLNGVNLKIPVNVLREIKDPKSYSPLILNLTNNISSTYTLLISLGLMSLTTALEHYSDRRQITNNGLYYLLRLNNYN